jgi:hypothetical protein
VNRYYKQRDSFSCGSVAILNALMWAYDKIIPYYYIKFINFFIGCVPVIGTQNGTKMEHFLRLYNIKVGRRVRVTIDEIDAHLENGGAVLLRYVKKEIDRDLFLGHYAFFDKKENGRYYGANINKKAYDSVGRRTMIKYLKVKKDKYLRTDLPWGWFIYKNRK